MGKRSHQEGWVPRTKPKEEWAEGAPGYFARPLADTPGPVGERRRAEADKKYLEERDRKVARQKVKRALDKLAKLTKDRPMLSAEKVIVEATQVELISRLQDEEQLAQMTPNMLNRIKDSAIGSVARMEQWDRPKGSDPKDALSAITTAMRDLKGKLRIEVSVEPEAETIDVTPVRSMELPIGE